MLFITGYAANGTRASGLLDPDMEIVIKLFAVAALAIRIRALIQRE